MEQMAIINMKKDDAIHLLSRLNSAINHSKLCAKNGLCNSDPDVFLTYLPKSYWDSVRKIAKVKDKHGEHGTIKEHEKGTTDMPTKTWKKRERQVAKFFGTERTPLSGGSSKHTRSDTLHKNLFIEEKHRKSSSMFSWLRDALPMARKENKVPMVALSIHGAHGFYVFCHCDDLIKIANERIKVLRGEILDSLNEKPTGVIP